MKVVVLLTAILGASLARALDYDQLSRDLDQATSKQEIQRILRDRQVSFEADPSLATKAGQAIAVPVPDEALINQIKAAVRIRAIASGSRAPKAKVDIDALRKAKRSPLYNDPGAREQSNWLQKSLESFGDWLRRLFQRPNRESATPRLPGVSIVPTFLTTVVWVVIGAVALAALAVAVKLIAQGRKKVDRSRGLVADEELKLSLDEWLERADALIAQGHYREAVRCLYIACLLRLDQASVIEFRRHETNWEHYHRFCESDARPDFNFLVPTREFDSIWYGHRCKGEEDAVRFKSYYQNLLDILNPRRAA
ncbi:MAG: hypothetical protein IT206_01985 [Fimbriimonadaceae bacterium]|nr:hypothetical protein [Fimbriimonadaceae bacterium]